MTVHDTIESLKDRTEDAHGCWIWQGATTSDGYAVVRRARALRYVHRIAYELSSGPIPDGLQVDHLCRNRGCINPAHLEAVTQRENILRGTAPAAINAAKTHCAHGHEFSPDNTYLRPDGGGRQCRTCTRERQARMFKTGVYDPEADPFYLPENRSADDAYGNRPPLTFPGSPGFRADKDTA